MAVGTTLSRLTGLLRIVALFYAVGFGPVADAYNLANTVPNIVTDLVLGGVLSATFVPVFVERLTRRRRDEAWDALSAVSSVSFIVIAVASVAFLVAAPFIVDALMAANHTAHAAAERHVATDLLVLFAPQLTAYLLIALSTALLNARRSFAAPTFAPIVNNLLLVGMLVLFGAIAHDVSVGTLQHDERWLLLLGLGTTVGVIAQALVLIPALRRAELELRWLPSFRHEAVRTVVRLSGWTFGLVVTNQVALVVVLATLAPITGGVSAYTYAYAFFQLPYGIVAVSIMTATAPELAEHWTTGDLAAFRHRMALSLRAMLAIVVPAAAGMVILARPLVALLGHATQHASATGSTGVALSMLALGLPGFCVFLYCIRVLQSIQDLRSAFWLYVVENGINVVLAVALVGPLGVRGVMLSISIAYTVAAVVALNRVRTRVHGLDADLVASPLRRVLLATAALVVAAALGANVTATSTGAGVLVRLVVGTAAGAAAYVLAAGLLARYADRRVRRTPHDPNRATSSSAEGGPRGVLRTPGPPAAGADDEDDERRVAPTTVAATSPGRRARPGRTPPPGPARLPPAGRPPAAPPPLGPTRKPGSPDPGRGKLDP
jgi:putative peptidoglycan lipid II flippase